MRHRLLPTLLAVFAVLTAGAAPARADWLGLPGLQAAGWVREYATASIPTTMYAATEGNGVYKSVTNGLTWSSFSSGLTTVPGAMDVRTVFTSGASTVYAGTSAGLFKSEGGGAFQPVAQGPEDDPKNPKKLNQAVQTVFTGLVPGQMIAGVASGGVYRSSDGGATWQPPSPDNGMARAETVWSIGSYKDGLLYAATGSGIYVSLNFGATWTRANDGITGQTLRTFADDKFPTIYYASGTDGVFRSINAGLTWSNLGAGGGQARALTQFSGVNEKRLYVGTENGVYAGTTGLGLLPGPVKWRKVANDGLGNNTILWALTSFINTPGTLIAGTQSNGGYALTFTPPSNSGAKPAISNLSPKMGETITTTNGGWSGTPTIEFEYQWQDCTVTCTDIDDATTNSLVVPKQGGKYRVSVIAKNDFPTGSFVHAESATTNAAGAKPGSLPGDTQQSTASIEVQNDPDGFPQPGEKLHAKNWLFNPTASLGTTFQWYRCVSAADCKAIAGATAVDYILTDEDVTQRLCVTVTGKNGSGSTTLGCSGQTNEIFPKAPKATKATTMDGKAYIGDTLVSGVGQWEWAGTQFTRQWESCEADGSSCQTLSGEKSATYIVKAADLGRRLRVRIGVDSNQANKKPDPIEVFTPLSDVVTPAPVIPDPVPQGGGGGGGGGSAAAVAAAVAAARPRPRRPTRPSLR